MQNSLYVDRYREIEYTNVRQKIYQRDESQKQRMRNMEKEEKKKSTNSYF